MNPRTLMTNFPILIGSRKLKSGMKALVLCQGTTATTKKPEESGDHTLKALDELYA